jgi:hypothetical protein
VSDEDASFIAPPFDEGADTGRQVPPPPAPVHAEPEMRPASPPPAEAQPAAAEREMPRRRSTIREPAPVAAEGAPPPAATVAPPTPVISSTAPEETATPKRGWWGKRLLGDKG